MRSTVVTLMMLGFTLGACAPSSGPANPTPANPDPMATSETGNDTREPHSGTRGTSSQTESESNHGGTHGDRDSTGSDDVDTVQAIVAVGYGGMRIRSLDDGRNWSDYTAIMPNGRDDEALLRSVAFGAGRFAAVGWRIFSSADGVTWVEHDNPSHPWYGAVQYGNDQFLAAGGGGACVRSIDGMHWEACTDVTEADFTHVRSVLFLDARFYAADDHGVLRSSPDGDVWTVEDAAFGSPWATVVDGDIVSTPQQTPAELPTVRLRGRGASVWRAEPGDDQFVDVFTVPQSNGVFQAYQFAFAVGSVAAR